jgi:hypothetical protein
VVGFTTGSRAEVPGKKENLWQEMMMMMIIIIIIISFSNYGCGEIRIHWCDNIAMSYP